MTAGRPFELDRIRHVQNELLQRSDISDQVNADRELLWWHQRAVHLPGTVAGLTTRVERFTRSVVVSPGLAYDARGRELVLRSEARVRLPLQFEPAVLLVRATAEGRDAQVLWRALGALDSCDGIPIAFLDEKGGVRPSTPRARLYERPHVAAGETFPDATAWDLWPFSEEQRLALGVQVRVDTSAAGFTDVPCYFAWLNWPRPETRLRIAETYPSLGLQYVQNETTSGFLFRVHVRLPRGRARADDAVLSFARRERLSVCWLGVECHEPSTKRRDHVVVR